jgi:TIR domain-containing protein
MGYLQTFDSRFEEDVFISYAHHDDDAFGREPRGWVSQLHMDLKNRVTAYLGVPKGSEPSLWRDSEIRTNEDFDEKIRGRLGKTATFLSVISPSFLGRDWCLKELAAFEDFAKETLGLLIQEGKWRIFKVEKLQVDRRNWPQTLQQGTRSYKFYGPDPEDGDAVHEFRPLLGEANYQRYFREMDELARDIATVLQEMMHKCRGTTAIAAPGIAVYLAETTSDIEDDREEIRRELEDRGYVVLPSGDLPYRAKDFKEQVRNYLKRSVLSVHLVGTQHGLTFEGEEKSRDWLQNDLAMERAEDPDFRRLVWVLPGAKPTDPRQRQFIEYLTEDPAAQRGADIFTTNLADLKTNIQNRLREIQRRAEGPRPAVAATRSTGAAAPRPTDAPPVRIYIICDQEDLGSPGLDAMRKFLFQKGYEPILPSGNEDEGEALEEHTENLALCDACIIYWGAGSKQWFLAKLRDFRKFLSRRNESILARAFYITAPKTPDKDALETHEADVLRASESFDPEILTDLLGKLNRAAKSEMA